MATTALYTLSIRSNHEPCSGKKNVQFTNISLTSSPLPMEDLLTQVKRLERRTFPKAEAMDFDAELKKRSTELIIVLDTSPPGEAIDFTISEATRQPPKSLLVTSARAQSSEPSPQSTDYSTSQTLPALVVAYALHARSAGVSLLHKVCVAEKYRRQGIANQLLTILKTKLEAQGCEKIQLWVDWQRDGAIELYKNVGFRRIDGARDYYGVGRHGVKMAMDLTWVW